MNLTITPQFTQVKNNNQKLNILAFPAQKPNLPANSNLAPLARDMVSFSGKEKFLKAASNAGEELINGLPSYKVASSNGSTFYAYESPSSIAISMVRDAVVPMEYLKNVFREYFRRDTSVVAGKDRPILEIHGRIKEWTKVKKKLETIGEQKAREAEERGETFVIENKAKAKELVTDVIGLRPVFRERDKKAVAKEMQVLEQMHKDGKIKIKQIEVYYPHIESADTIPAYVLKSWQRDFGWTFSDKQLKAMTDPEYFMIASKKDITRLAETAGLDMTDPNQVKFASLPNGYPATHMLLECPDGSIVEAQFMYRDVEGFKDLLEDGRYKVFCNKTEGLYKPLVERFGILTKEGNGALKKEHTSYTFWTYVTQMLKPSESYLRKTSQRYLTAPDILRREGLGYNQIAPIAREGKAWQKAQKKASKVNPK